MHVGAFEAVARMLRAVPATPKSVVELGSCYINGSVRSLFNGAAYVGVDVVEGKCVDVVCDAATFQPEVAPDCVVCCEVLEHAEGAKDIVANAVKILAPGGTVIITCASDGRTPHSAVDGGPVRAGEFYRNVPPATLQAWLEEAGARSVHVEYVDFRGDVYAMGFKP